MTFYDVRPDTSPGASLIASSEGSFLFRTSDDYLICFFTRGFYDFMYRVSSDLGVTWGSDVGAGQYMYMSILQDGDDIWACAGSTFVESGHMFFRKFTYQGSGVWTQLYVGDGGSNYLSSLIAACFTSDVDYPIKATWRRVSNTTWDTSACMNKECVGAVSSTTGFYSPAGNSIRRSNGALSKVMYASGSEFTQIIVQEYTLAAHTAILGTGVKARYVRTGVSPQVTGVFPAASTANPTPEGSDGVAFCDNVNTAISCMTSYQETPTSEPVILISTTDGLKAFDSSLSSPYTISPFPNTDGLSLGKIGANIYCMFRNGDSPYGFYYAKKAIGSNTWETPKSVGSTQNVNYLRPSIIKSDSEYIRFVFYDTSGTYGMIKISEGITPFNPPWVDAFGYYELPCGYAGQVSSTLPNVSHLPDGQVVAIFADGEVLEEQAISSGTVTIPDGHSKVHIGLPYYADFETLNVEAPTNEGTIQSKREKINNVTIELRDSRGGWLGPNEDDLWEGFEIDALRQSSGQNLGEFELFTGQIRQNVAGQYDAEGHIFIRQVDPLPISIGSVIPEVDIGGQAR